MKKLLAAGAIAASLVLSTPALASTVVLDFTGVATTNNSTTIGGFYNGGTSGDGNSGTNYGVEFSPNALAINNYNGGNEPDPGILFFLSGGEVTLNYSAGFTTGFSFFYASNSNATINVYDGLNGTGNLLASLALTNNFSSTCAFCVWDPIGVSFAGVARSIDFGGGANAVGYDRVTFGSSTPGAVPEPGTWAMMLLGFGAIGWSMRRTAARNMLARTA